MKRIYVLLLAAVFLAAGGPVLAQDTTESPKAEAKADAKKADAKKAEEKKPDEKKEDIKTAEKPVKKKKEGC